MLVAEGYSNSQLARMLWVTEQTGEVPPVQHLPEAQRRQPDRGEPLGAAPGAPHTRGRAPANPPPRRSSSATPAAAWPRESRLAARWRRASYRAGVKRVYLLRHAKSAWDDPHAPRPRPPTGAARAERQARNGWAVGRGSPRRPAPARRLLERGPSTRDPHRMLPALGEPEVWVEVTLYAASADTLLERIGAFPDEVDDAMLVGHNPGVMDLVLLLARPGSPAIARPRTCQPVRSRCSSSTRAAGPTWRPDRRR